MKNSIIKSKIKNLEKIVENSGPILKLISEFFLSFIIISFIIMPLSLAQITGPNAHPFFQIWDYNIWVAFYIVFVIWFFIIIFHKVSSDFNPVVSIVKIFAGDDSVRFGVSKIGMQVLGSLAATFMTWGIADSIGMTIGNETTLGGPFMGINIPEEWGGWITEKDIPSMTSWMWIIKFICEGTSVFLLVWALFSVRHKKYKKTFLSHLTYVCTILFGAMIIGGTFFSSLINPGVVLTTSLVSNWMEGNREIMNLLWIHILPQLTAAFIYGIYKQQEQEVKIRF